MPHPINCHCCSAPDNAYWIPRFVIHGRGTYTDPFLVDSDEAPSSPCKRARHSLFQRRLIHLLKQGSQEGAIN